MRTRISIIFIFLVMASSGCKNLNVSPSDAIDTETLITTPSGLTNALNGAYALFKDHIEFNGIVDENNMYLRQY